MKLILACRRTFIAALGILCITYLGVHNGIDVSLAITGAIVSICGANATESIMKKESK